MIRFAAYLASYLAYPFSFLVPRSRKMLAFGAPRGGYEGNAKYLFIRLSEEGRDAVWLSPDKACVRRIRQMGLRAEYIFSPRGLWRALRSGLWFVNAYTSDILWALSGGACVVNLWHGVGLKRTEFNITSGPLAARYAERRPREVFYHPEAFRRPDLLVSASDFQTPMFAKAFRIPENRCLKCSYPRNAILTTGEDQRRKFLEFNCNDEEFALLNRIRQAKGPVYIYMPTWRESQRTVFTDGIDLNALDSILSEKDGLLILKPHYNTRVPEAKAWRSVVSIGADSDVYPLLPYTDCLITDYSSILYDYILMPGKSVILYLYDYNDYVRDRDFYFPFEENTIGQKAYTREQLESIIKQGPQALDEVQRQALADKFWGKERHDISDYLHL